MIREISLEDNLDWTGPFQNSQTVSFFQSKEWLTLWVKYFASKDEIKILGIYEGDELIGIAPLRHCQDKVTFLSVDQVLGGELVSDYGDIIAKISYEKIVWNEVLVNLKSQISKLKTKYKKSKIEFDFIREDSPSFRILEKLGGKAEKVDIAPYIDLPESWDEYLAKLDRHDRHELRRKMRKLEGAGSFIVCPEPQAKDIDDFFRLMTLSSEQKRNFLKDEMKSFFRDIFATFQAKKMLCLSFLRIADKNVASALCFLFNNEVLLYNSGYDPAYSYLAPGLLLKACLIKQSLEEGKKRFDFLRGGERYKYDLGARERKLFKFSF